MAKKSLNYNATSKVDKTEVEPVELEEEVEETEVIEEVKQDDSCDSCGCDCDHQCHCKCKDMKSQLNAEVALEIISRHFAEYEKYLQSLQDIVVYRRKVKEFANMAIDEINVRYKETIALVEAN